MFVPLLKHMKSQLHKQTALLRELNLKRGALFLGFILIHWTLSAYNPPQNVSDSFKKQFPEAKAVKWTKTGEESKEYKVVFKHDKTEKTGYFDLYGNLVEVTFRISPAELPESIITWLDGQYKSYKVISCYKVMKSGTELLYHFFVRSNGKKTSLVMNSNGNLYERVTY